MNNKRYPITQKIQRLLGELVTKPKYLLYHITFLQFSIYQNSLYI